MLYMCAVLSVIVYSIRTDPLLFCLHCPHLKAGNTPHILYVLNENSVCSDLVDSAVNSSNLKQIEPLKK